MGKRRFLKTLGAVGVSASALRHMSKETLAKTTGDPTEEVPMLKCLRHTNHEEVQSGKKPERKPEYFTLPRDEWAQIKASEHATLKLKEKLRSDSELPTLPVGVQMNVSGHHARCEVVVEYPVFDEASVSASQSEQVTKLPTVSYAQVKGKLPETIEGTAGSDEFSETVQGIPVKLEKVENPRLNAYFTHEYRPVPGGCSMARNGEDHMCTIGTPAYKSNHGNVLITAGHCTNGQDTDIHQPYDQLFTDEHIGQVHQSVGENYTDSDVTKFDAATIRLDSEDSVTYNIANYDDDTYLRRDIGGIWSWDAISAWNGESTEITLQGKNTGRSSGPVNKLYPDTKNYAIQANSDGGDSGGPHYRRRCDTCDDLLIAGVHSGSNAYGAVATAMEEIESRFSLSV